MHWLQQPNPNSRRRRIPYAFTSRKLRLSREIWEAWNVYILFYRTGGKTISPCCTRTKGRLELSPWTSGPESLLSFRTWLQILGLIWYSESLWLYSPGFCRRYPTGLLSFEFFCDFSVLREKTKAHKSSNDSRLTKLTAILAIVQIFSPDLRL